MTDKPRRIGSPTKAQGLLRAEVPVGRFDSTEQRPGALEIDLVEHNGGSSLGQFAYTLHMVDVVTGFSRRRAVLGRSQRVVFDALSTLLGEWRYAVWALHTDNGSEFLSHHLVRFTRERSLRFERGRPYHKNDQPYVEQKNRQLVREVVGYARYDTPEAVAWLNAVYAVLDPLRQWVRAGAEGGRQASGRRQGAQALRPGPPSGGPRLRVRGVEAGAPGRAGSATTGHQPPELASPARTADRPGTAGSRGHGPCCSSTGWVAFSRG
ncbi:MAG: DDE-type integrase/transposase/recombinase [Bacillota bacterium]